MGFGPHASQRSVNASRNQVATRSLSDNLPLVTENYKFQDGYFGDEGSREWIRRIKSDNPENTADDFFKKISLGGKAIEPEGHCDKMIQLLDGTKISYRSTSKSQDPAVSIGIRGSNDPAGVKKQKIHFC